MWDKLPNPLLIALGVYVIAGLIISRGVVADPGLSVAQKIMQILIVWLIPVFGMMLVLVMQGNNHSRQEMKSLVPFPFYLAGYAEPRDGSLAPPVQDGCGDVHGGTGCESD